MHKESTDDCMIKVKPWSGQNYEDVWGSSSWITQLLLSTSGWCPVVT